MKVKRLTMQSFRGIGDLTLEFDLKGVNIIFGVNGVGKSSILDALSLLLSRFMEWIGGVSPKDEVRAFRELDIYNKDILTRLSITILLSGREDYWEISRSRNGVSIEIKLLAEGYEKLDVDGQHTPFCAAISYLLKNYF